MAGRQILQKVGRVPPWIVALVLAGAVVGLGGIMSSIYGTTTPVGTGLPLSVSASGLSGSKLMGAWYPFSVNVTKNTEALPARIGFFLQIRATWDMPQNISCGDVGVTLGQPRFGYPFGQTIEAHCSGPESYVDPTGSTQSVLSFAQSFYALGDWYELAGNQTALTITGEVNLRTQANFTWFIGTASYFANLSSVVTVKTLGDPTSPISVAVDGLSTPKLIGAWYPISVVVTKDQAALSARVEYYLRFDVAWNLSQNISCLTVGIGLVRAPGSPYGNSSVPVACEGPEPYQAPNSNTYTVVSMWAGYPLYQIAGGQSQVTIPGEAIFELPADYTWFVWAQVGLP